MTIPRKQIVSLSNTSYYQCVARCVRRAFLCGEDSLTGKDYDHRKQWIVDRLNELSAVFAIDLCAYAVMSNHYHVILKIGQERQNQWSDKEVIERWKQIFNGPLLV